MERETRPALVAKVGAVVFAWALGAPIALPSAAAQPMSVITASVVSDVALPVARGETAAMTTIPLNQLVSTTIADLQDVPSLPVGTAVLARASGAVADPRPAPRAAIPSAAPRRAEPPPEALIRDGVVIASWYGPGFYGRRTACGQTYTPEIVGVAHRLLKCGTLIRITSPAGITLTVPVIDRGPYIAGRALDFSNATRLALQCRDLCRVRMVVQ